MRARRHYRGLLVMFAWCIVAPAPRWVFAQDPNYQETDGLPQLRAACSRLRSEGHKLPPQTRELLNAQGVECLAVEKLYFDGKQPIQRKIKEFESLPKPTTDDEKAKRSAASNDLAAQVQKDGEQVAARYAEFVRIVDQSFPALTIPVAKWIGDDWKDEEKNLVKVTLGAFQDKELRDWIASHVAFTKSKVGASSLPVSTSDMIGAINGTLNIGGGFFTSVKINTASDKEDKEKEISQALLLQLTRENAFAFDAGRAAFFQIKGKIPQQGDPTLEDYVRQHANVILLMKSAQHRGQGLSKMGGVAIADNDSEARFAYAFRAAALKLKNPGGKEMKEEWNKVVDEVRKRMGIKTRQ